MTSTGLAQPSQQLAAGKSSFPFLNLKAQYKTIAPEVMEAIAQVLESQHFIMGPVVEKLERELSDYIGCRVAIGCASGSDALLLALMALGVDTDDEVITTPFTFVATAGAIARLKAKPVFVDIDPVTFNLEPSQVEAAITPRTKAIIPVHLFGLPAAMDQIMAIAQQHHLPVVEDAAQSIAARYKGESVGNIGTVGCYSFFPAKNLGCYGDGGLISTNDEALAKKMRVLRVHGGAARYQYDLLGVNSRLDALQAAILRVKLRHLDEWTQARQRNADRYRRLFASAGLARKITLPTVPVDCEHVYNQFVIRLAERDALRAHLRDSGIPTEVYYPSPLHLQPAFAYLNHREGDFPESERACKEVLALPICPTLTEDAQQLVVESIADYFAQK